eukprot:3427175-Prymnesium_polylepis.1
MDTYASMPHPGRDYRTATVCSWRAPLQRRALPPPTCQSLHVRSACDRQTAPARTPPRAPRVAAPSPSENTLRKFGE